MSFGLDPMARRLHVDCSPYRGKQIQRLFVCNPRTHAVIARRLDPIAPSQTH